MDTTDHYFSEILENSRIQEWFTGDPDCTFEQAVDSIVESHPPPEGINRQDISDWFRAEIIEFNADNEVDNQLPL